MDNALVNWFRDLPGEIVSLGTDHPYVMVMLGVLGAAMVYIGAFVLYQRRQDRRDARVTARRYR